MVHTRLQPPLFRVRDDGVEDVGAGPYPCRSREKLAGEPDPAGPANAAPAAGSTRRRSARPATASFAGLLFMAGPTRRATTACSSSPSSADVRSGGRVRCWAARRAVSRGSRQPCAGVNVSRSPGPSTYSAEATFGGQRSPRLKVTASKGRMRTGASSCAVAISTHSPSRSSKAFRSLIRHGHRPTIDRADELCRALGITMTIGACVFRTMWIADFGGSGSPVSVEVDHRFRRKWIAFGRTGSPSFRDRERSSVA